MESASHKVDNSTFRALITEKEIAKNIRETTKNSAPGPDGITLGDLSKMDPKYSWMMEVFKLWIVSVTIPDVGRECQTVLIPKSNKPDHLRDINNWRHSTICSIVLRLFSRIITARLTKACPIHLRQRGFLRAAGCSENLKLLQLLIRNPKKELRELAIVFVDIAFDTGSHHHILMGLKQKEVDPHVIHLMKNTYKNIDTCITTKNEKSAPSKILKGAKQGDPMSSLLFNVALDPLLCELEAEVKGYQPGRKSITAMAFADNLVWLSDSWEGVTKNIIF